MHAVVLSNARKVCTWSPIHTWWNLNNSWTDTLRKRTRCAFDGWNLKKSWTDTLVRPATRTFGVCSYNARSAVRCRSVHRQHQHHARWGWKRERVATRTHGRDVLYRFPPKGFTAAIIAIITSRHLSLYNRIKQSGSKITTKWACHKLTHGREFTFCLTLWSG